MAGGPAVPSTRGVGARRRRTALLILLAACGLLAAVTGSTVALRRALRSPEERAADAAGAARAREEAERVRLAREVVDVCRREIEKQVRPPLTARFDSDAERLGYEPVRGEAYVVGEVATRDGTGPTSRHEYVCRLKRQGTTWLTLVAAIR